MILVQHGDSVNISCSIYGKISSSYNFEWTKNNRPTNYVHTSVELMSAYENPSTIPSDVELLYDRVVSTLHISKAKYLLDNGTYQCKARDNNILLRDSIKLEIQGMLINLFILSYMTAFIPTFLHWLCVELNKYMSNIIVVLRVYIFGASLY